MYCGGFFVFHLIIELQALNHASLSTSDHAMCLRCTGIHAKCGKSSAKAKVQERCHPSQSSLTSPFRSKTSALIDNKEMYCGRFFVCRFILEPGAPNHASLNTSDHEGRAACGRDPGSQTEPMEAPRAPRGPLGPPSGSARPIQAPQVASAASAHHSSPHHHP